MAPTTDIGYMPHPKQMCLQSMPKVHTVVHQIQCWCWHSPHLWTGDSSVMPNGWISRASQTWWYTNSVT